MVLPDAIDHDPGREGIGRADDGPGQLQPTTALGEGRRLVPGNDAQESSGHHLPRMYRISPDGHRDVLRSGLGDAVDVFRFRGQRLFEGFQLRRQGVDDLLLFLHGIDFVILEEDLGGLGPIDAFLLVLEQGFQELVAVGHLGRHHPLPGHILGVEENPCQGVIVLGGNGIELVVVAAGAGDRQAQNGPGQGVDLVIHGVIAVAQLAFLSSAIAFIDGTQGKETQRAPPFHTNAAHQVSGDLLHDEPVVAQVPIEGLHHPIPIPVGVGQGIGRVVVGPLFFRVAGHVQPIAGPALAVVGRGQQAVDHGFMGLGRGIPQEGLDLLGGRRQADQVKGDPAKPGAPVGRSHRFQSLLFQAGQHKAVEGGTNPVPVPHGGQRRLSQGLKGPECAPLLQIDGVPGRCGSGSVDPRVRGAEPHPLLQELDFLQGQGPLRGHGQLGVLVVDGLNQETSGGVSGNNGGASAPAAHPSLPGVQAQAPHGSRLSRMAGVAALDQQRADLGFEEFDLRGLESMGLRSIDIGGQRP